MNKPPTNRAQRKDKPGRLRLDQLLVDRGLVESRSQAQALILAGKVRVGDGDAARLDRKPGDVIHVDTAVLVTEPAPYVSRGGHKMAAALDAFEIDPSGLVGLDVGASTGGFTDVLLQRGASKVYALDVGRGQLAESLRRDPRVVSMERTNARDLDGDHAARAGRYRNDRCFVHLAGPRARARGGDAAARTGQPDRGTGQAAVRGGPGADGPRRRPRSGWSIARCSNEPSQRRSAWASARAR